MDPQEPMTSHMEWLQDDAILVVHPPRLDMAVALRNRRKLETLIDAQAPRWLIIDGRQVTFYAPEARIVAERQFHRFRELGGEEILLVTYLPMLRMIAGAVSAVAGVPIRLMTDMQVAFAHIRAARND